MCTCGTIRFIMRECLIVKELIATIRSIFLIVPLLARLIVRRPELIVLFAHYYVLAPLFEAMSSANT